MTRATRSSFSAASLGIAACLALIVFGSSRPVGWLRTSAIYALRPLASLAGYARRAITPGASEWPESSPDGRGDIAAEEVELAALRKENESLRAALAMKEEVVRPLVAGRVWWYANDDGRESLIIDRGKNHGVRRGDPVIDQNRMLVGDVAEAGQDFSKVNVASNRGTTFAAAFSSGEEALMRGLGARSFSVELVPESAPVSTGDFVMSVLKNIRGIKPVFVGRIARVGAAACTGFRTLSVTLAARPERLERVWVIAAPQNP